MATVTDKKAPDLTFENVCAALRAERIGQEWLALCPAHNDHNPSLSIARGSKQPVVFTCRAGCNQGAIFEKVKERVSAHFGNERHPTTPAESARPKKASELPDWQGFTLQDYCRLKKLSGLALGVFYGTYVSDDLFTLETTHKGKPVVAFPYKDATGKILATKMRLSHDSHDTYFRPKDPRIPYGLWLYTNRPNKKGKYPRDIVIVEGESDQQTLTNYNIPALGISGNNGWKSEFADIDVIRNAERIFIIKESPSKAGDKSGEIFVERVGKDLPPEKVFVLTLPVKDPSELHLRSLDDPFSPGFLVAFDSAVAEAQPFQPAIQKTENEPFNYSDSGHAERLVKWHGENFRWVNELEKFYFWNDDAWKSSRSGLELLPWTLDVARTKIEDKDEALKAESLGKRNAMITLAKGDQKVWADKEQFNQQPMLLNVLNGTVDLQTQTLREACREDYLVGRSPIVYDARATCPRFDDFMEFTFGGDTEAIHWMDKALGYTLTGQTGEHIFFLCHGAGANGKSTLFSLMRAILGHDLALAGRFSTFTEHKGGYEKPNYELANFFGKRLVTASEPSKTALLNETLLKDITGGEDIMARQIKREVLTYKPQLKLWLGMNKLPTICGTDEGIWRRVRLIPFTQTVTKQRKILDYEQVLFKEAPGILNRLLGGVRDYLAEGLEPVGAIAAATNEYRSSQNAVQRFIDAECVTGNPNMHVKCGTLYDAYKKWAVEHNEYVMSMTELSQYLERHFKKDRVHNDGEHRFGIGLKAAV